MLNSTFSLIFLKLDLKKDSSLIKKSIKKLDSSSLVKGFHLPSEMRKSQDNNPIDIKMFAQK